jgi:hypothetical protein
MSKRAAVAPVPDSEAELARSIARLIDNSSVSDADALAALLTVSGRLAANLQFPAEKAKAILGNVILKCRGLDASGGSS